MPPHDATTTENVSVPILPLNPLAPWRPPEDKDNTALGCLSITSRWDPGATTEGLCALPGSSVSQVSRNAMQRGATSEGLCALHCSFVSQVTRSADCFDMIEAASPPNCLDPGRPNGLHHLLPHPPLLRNDATATENVNPLPPLKPCVSMRDLEDEVKLLPIPLNSHAP
jgi:hypothetical protein